MRICRQYVSLSLTALSLLAAGCLEPAPLPEVTDASAPIPGQDAGPSTRDGSRTDVKEDEDSDVGPAPDVGSDTDAGPDANDTGPDFSECNLTIDSPEGDGQIFVSTEASGHHVYVTATVPYAYIALEIDGETSEAAIMVESDACRQTSAICKWSIAEPIALDAGIHCIRALHRLNSEGSYMSFAARGFLASAP